MRRRRERDSRSRWSVDESQGGRADAGSCWLAYCARYRTAAVVCTRRVEYEDEDGDAEAEAAEEDEWERERGDACGGAAARRGAAAFEADGGAVEPEVAARPFAAPAGQTTTSLRVFLVAGASTRLDDADFRLKLVVEDEHAESAQMSSACAAVTMCRGHRPSGTWYLDACAPDAGAQCLLYLAVAADAHVKAGVVNRVVALLTSGTSAARFYFLFFLCVLFHGVFFVLFLTRGRMRRNERSVSSRRIGRAPSLGTGTGTEMEMVRWDVVGGRGSLPRLVWCPVERARSVVGEARAGKDAWGGCGRTCKCSRSWSRGWGGEMKEGHALVKAVALFGRAGSGSVAAERQLLGLVRRQSAVVDCRVVVRRRRESFCVFVPSWCELISLRVDRDEVLVRVDSGGEVFLAAGPRREALGLVRHRRRRMTSGVESLFASTGKRRRRKEDEVLVRVDSGCCLCGADVPGGGGVGVVAALYATVESPCGRPLLRLEEERRGARPGRLYSSSPCGCAPSAGGSRPLSSGRGVGDWKVEKEEDEVLVPRRRFAACTGAATPSCLRRGAGEGVGVVGREAPRCWCGGPQSQPPLLLRAHTRTSRARVGDRRRSCVWRKRGAVPAKDACTHRPRAGAHRRRAGADNRRQIAVWATDPADDPRGRG
ncbi:hypothetical protein B0H16DRAFT_1464287 [Mycena metata]|uniref:Uncharacterized protein n=1 Tax=Mycena metata TaxID=1033252 RepID=A0AAD7IFE5_9AGAR|nr:hypothetical protein B0H16DRAFT_1464287 [Mycena metata]